MSKQADALPLGRRDTVREPFGGGRQMKIIASALLAVASVMALPLSAPADTNVLKVTHAVNFGTRPVGSFTIKTATVANTRSEPIALDIDIVRDWDDFSTALTGTTCSFFEPQVLAPGESCVLLVGFRPSEDFIGLKQDQILLVTATDPPTSAVLDSVRLTFFGRAR
jgi:hypothetical protein